MLAVVGLRLELGCLVKVGLPRTQQQSASLFRQPGLLHVAQQRSISSEDDLTRIDVVTTKVKRLLDSARDKLQIQPQEQILASLFALIQLLAQYKERHSDARTEVFRESGRTGVYQDIEGLDGMFDLADWAYDKNTVALKQKLKERGQVLLRHDTTALAGYLGHYMSINKAQKVALIGVKGTSSLEDLLTDCCGLSVPHTLQTANCGTNSLESPVITCHDGILISAQQLTEDLHDIVQELILPAGYQLKIVGHSLGAAGAAMLALLLKTRIPALAQMNDQEMASILQVYAFACPPILDYQTAKALSPYVTTIVNNADIIPRASLSNVAITLNLLRDVYRKLVKRGMDANSFEAGAALLGQLSQGSQGDLLMDVREFLGSLGRSAAKMDPNDPNHLFVPGKVLIMYDSWEKSESSSPDSPTAQGFVVAEDGSARVLRTLPMNERMISDHLSESYRSSLRSLLELTKPS